MSSKWIWIETHRKCIGKNPLLKPEGSGKKAIKSLNLRNKAQQLALMVRNITKEALWEKGLKIKERKIKISKKELILFWTHLSKKLGKDSLIWAVLILLSLKCKASVQMSTKWINNDKASLIITLELECLKLVSIILELTLKIKTWCNSCNGEIKCNNKCFNSKFHLALELLILWHNKNLTGNQVLNTKTMLLEQR